MGNPTDLGPHKKIKFDTWSDLGHMRVTFVCSEILVYCKSHLELLSYFQYIYIYIYFANFSKAAVKRVSFFNRTCVFVSSLLWWSLRRAAGLTSEFSGSSALASVHGLIHISQLNVIILSSEFTDFLHSCLHTAPKHSIRLSRMLSNTFGIIFGSSPRFPDGGENPTSLLKYDRPRQRVSLLSVFVCCWDLGLPPDWEFTCHVEPPSWLQKLHLALKSL